MKFYISNVKLFKILFFAIFINFFITWYVNIVKQIKPSVNEGKFEFRDYFSSLNIQMNNKNSSENCGSFIIDQ